MKKTLNVVRYALVSLFSFLFIGSAMAEKMYNNPLDGKANVPAGTYGDITVSGNGYSATAFASNTDFTDAAVAGTWKDSLKINTHTWSAWYKIDALPASGWKAIYADRTATDGSYGGYALSVGSDGKLKVGRCNGSLQYNDGVEFSAGIAANTWYYITVVMSENSSTLTPSVYVNGVAVSASSGTTFASGMNGSRYSKFTLGAGVSAAGLYIDTTALSDVATIKSLATDANYVVPYVPAVEATITAAAVKVSDINNAPEFTSCGATDKVVVKLTAAKTLEFDTTLEFAGVDIVYDGALKLLANAVPADFAKFNFAGVTSIDYGWIVVGSGMAINFRHNGEGLGDDEDAGISGLTIYGKCWNNGGASGNVEAKMFAPGGDSVIADTMSVTWNSGNTWYNNAATSPLLKGYLDDSNITFSTTVPFGYYDVYIICTTDNGSSFLYKTVNDIAYIAGANGVAVEKASVDTWGNPSEKIPVLGSNVMKLSGLTSKNLTITSPNAAKPKRGCIAAIVIVKAEPPAETVKATIAEDTTWSALWATAPTANTPVELTFVGSATLTIDTEVVAKDIKIFGNATSAQTITLAGDLADAFLGKVISIDDSASTASTTFDFNVGAMPVKAGANTIVKGVNNGNLTIDSGKKLTVKGGSLTASKITNAGTLNFEGGSEDAPIAVTGDKNLGKVTLGENTFVKYDDKGTARLYDITGSGATSVFTIARNDNGAPGFTNGSNKFNNVIVESVATGNNSLWFEHTKPVSDTVGLKLTGNIKISDDTPDPVVVRSITGSGTLDRNGSLGLSIKNMEDAEFAGACNFPITVDASEFTQTFSGNFTGALTVNAGGKVKLTGSAKPSSMTINGEVTIDATDGDVVVSGTVVNNGTINVVGGNVIFMPGTANGAITTEGAGKVLYGYTVNINDCGKFTIPAGKTAQNIRLFDGAGNVITFTDNDDGSVSYDWEITGGACWWDYEFEGNDNNDGTDGTRLSWDGGHPRSGAEYTEDGELYISSVPWRGGVNWPEKATFVMYGTMVGTDKTYQIGFGSTYQGQQPYNTIFLATDTVSENTVNLCICQAKNAPTVLCQMTVPNAQTAKHLYAFTLKTVEGKTVVDIYLDGELLQSYPFDSQIVLGAGFQIGSGHGGTCAGYGRTAAGDEAVLDFLRVYKEDLSAEAHQKYAVLYPYVSPNGSYQRTVIAGADWSAPNAWTKEGTEPAETADAPAANATVKLTIDSDSEAATTIDINLAEDVTYEAIQINGDDVEFVLAEGEEFGGIAKSAGRVMANANITFAYDAFSMAGAPLTVKQGKTVTFDLSMVDMAQYFSTQTYDLTGYLTLEDGAEVTFIVPEELHGRTASAAIDPVTKHYVLTVTAPDYAFVYENGTWTWGTQVVDEETINVHPEVLRSIKSDLEMALGAYNYSVENGAILTQTDASATGTITINEGGTFDVNGVVDTALKIVLNGGSLINDGSDIDTGKKQYVSITQAAASTIGGSGDFGYVLIGYGANTLDLGGATLTKIGDNTFSLCNTTVQNGTLKIAAGTLATANKAVTIADTATIDGVKGAVLSVGSSISDFTLTGAITLAGAGTFGTITLDEAALDIDTVRGLTVAGEGTIAATITAAEMAGGSLTVFTRAEDATINSVTLVDESGTELTGYTADYDEDGNYIANFSVEVAIPTITGTTVAVTANDEPVDVINNKVAIPYGAKLIVTYTVEEGKIFKDGGIDLELEYDLVTVDPEIANDLDENDETVDAGAKIGDIPYLTITAALDDATTDDVVTVLQPAQLESLIVPEGVTLDLNNKAVVAQTIENNGTIVIYDAATALALIDTHGTIKFGALVMIEAGYMFPKDTVITITKMDAPGATESQITVPEEGILVNLAGAAAKKVMTVFFANPANSALLLAGAIQRGSHDIDTIINVGGYTLVGAPLIIGEDAEGMDYATYPNNKAKLVSTYIQFDDTMVEQLTGMPAQGAIQLIPEVGEVKTASNLASYVGTRLVTLEGAKIKDDFDGTLYTYTAEWIKPEASIKDVTVDGFDFAREYTAANDAPHYNDKTASFVLTANKAIPADAVQIGGKFSTMDWNTYNLPAIEANTEYKITEATWSQVKAISPFTCGATSLALTEDTEITLVLKLGDEVIDTFNATLKAKAIEPVVPGKDIDIPADKDPEVYAGEVEAQKATLLKAPVELTGEALTTYQGYFTAQVVGDNKVAFVLNADGEAEVKEAVKTVEADVLSVALSADTTEFTIAEPLKGFYYSLKQGGELAGLVFNDAGDKNKLAGKDDIKFTLTKPEGKGFYQTIVTPVEYK